MRRTENIQKNFDLFCLKLKKEMSVYSVENLTVITIFGAVNLRKNRGIMRLYNAPTCCHT